MSSRPVVSVVRLGGRRGVSVVVALGVALIVGTFVGTSGMTAYLDEELATRAPADLAVSRIGDSAVMAMRGSPELKDVTTFWTASVKVGELGVPVTIAPLRNGPSPRSTARTVNDASPDSLL
ncbi:hypothetical protein [Lentzea sp. E54]|uniref:hypothetical protein n=1 Tax=Lentzea xerophila TaxID=3435883 RepID=UPI003DA1FF2B